MHQPDTALHQLASQAVTASFVRSLHIPQVNDFMSILSVHAGKILTSLHWSLSLTLYDYNGCQLSTLPIPQNQHLCDAVWAPNGDIICVTGDSRKVIVLSAEDGHMKKQFKFSYPRCLSVTHEGKIILADYEKGIYHSTDNGMSWKHIFKLPNEANCWQAIQINKQSDSVQTLWTVASNKGPDRLQEFCLSLPSDGRNLWDQSQHDDLLIDLSRSALLCLPQNTGVLLADRINCGVHVFSTDGQYLYQMLSSNDGIYTPCRLAFDEEHALLFVAQFGEIKMFLLTFAKTLRG